MSAELPQPWASKGPLVRQYAGLCDASGDADPYEFLSRYPRIPRRQRADVVLFDQWYRWSQGRAVAVEEYEGRFPDLLEDPGLCLEFVCAEVCYLRDSGQDPQLTDFVHRFPDLAEPLRELLASGDAPTTSHGSRELTDGPETLAATIFSAHSSQEDIGFTDHGQEKTIVSEGTDPTRRRQRLVSLPPNVIALLQSHMVPRQFAPGEFLTRQGDPGDSLMVVAEGEVEISTVNEAGERTFIARVGRSQVIGEMALLTNLPRSADVVATMPVEALVLDAGRFHDLARQHPVISHVLTQLISRRLGQPGREDVLSGKTFDGYRIGRRLGRGGMAVVYEAEEVATGRSVALKMMSHRLVYDEAAREQFQREADIIQAFEHPNIVRVHGRFAAFHTYFLVMEFCNGETLERVIRRHGPLPEDIARKIIGQLAAALRHAHAAAIIHRDVKPGNVMLTGEGRALLMDFGLAKPVESKSAFDNLIVGTPRYMAPEQLRGLELDPTADIFALGCVLYEMLAGSPLISESQMSKVLVCHSRWELPIIDDRFPDIQPSTRQFLMNCLRYAPTDRQVDLDEIAAWAGDAVLGPISGDAVS